MKKCNQLGKGTLLVVSSVFSVAIMAGPTQHHGQYNRFMQFFDTNHDNIVTMDEFNKAAETRFNNMDADHNGVVTAEEFQAFISNKREEHRAQRFKEIDSNADGSISQQEYMSYKQKQAESRFQQLDTDKDGLVSLEEFASGSARMYGHKNWHGRDGKNSIFSRLDANGDGSISQQESLTAWTNWFNRIDANHDQTVTIDEIRSFRGHDQKSQ